jgi:hypothetical protein
LLLTLLSMPQSRISSFWPISALPTFVLLAALPCLADIVYRTDFENFAVGPNQLVGTEAWVGNSTNSGSHGIDLDAIPGSGLGKTAYIGYAPPSGSANPVVIYRPVNLDPANNSEPVIEFESLLGIKDSTNNYRDDFTISFYNISGTRLAAIRFHNDGFNSLIFRSDGGSQTNTNVSFLPGELHLLYVRLDLVMNRWSAFLDGIPLFNGATFNATSATRNLGSVGVDWRRGHRPIGVTTWGDNWMLIADWAVRTVPFAMESSTRNANGSFTLKWAGDPGRSYQVLHSSDLKVWHDTLPDSSLPVQNVLGTLSFTNSAPLPEKRFYRIARSP